MPEYVCCNQEKPSEIPGLDGKQEAWAESRRGRDDRVRFIQLQADREEEEDPDGRAQATNWDSASSSEYVSPSVSRGFISFNLAVV